MHRHVSTLTGAANVAAMTREAWKARGRMLQVWDDLGHYPQAEDPGKVAETVSGFFARIEARGAKGATVAVAS
jgi:pimeloyl-ACP methyl ester carboxylesterase